MFQLQGQRPRPTHSGPRVKSEPRRKHPQCWRQTLPLTEVLFQPVGRCQGFRSTRSRSTSCRYSSVSKWRHHRTLVWLRGPERHECRHHQASSGSLCLSLSSRRDGLRHWPSFPLDVVFFHEAGAGAELLRYWKETTACKSKCRRIQLFWIFLDFSRSKSSKLSR